MSWQTPENLSADEIAVLLGFTDAADFTAALAAKIAAATLTTNGDLLTRTAGVPARLGLGSALQVLRVNAAGTALEFAAASSAVNQLAEFSRITSTQGSLSGSYAANIVAFNNEVSNEGPNWTNSGGTLTCLTTGRYEILALVGVNLNECWIEIVQNSTVKASTYWQTSNALNWRQIGKTLDVTSGDTIKIHFKANSPGAAVIQYQDVGAAGTGMTWIQLRRVA